jgi:hypothetical protein
MDMDGSDDSLPRREDPRSARSWGEITADSLFSGVLGEEQENENEPHYYHGRPSHDLGRERLEQNNLAPLSVVLLEVDGFLTEE